MAIIKIRDLSFAYPLAKRRARSLVGPMRTEIPVFSDFSLEVEDGTRLALVGPNGAGKTTLLKLIAGILPPMKGLLRVEGRVSPLLNVQLGMERELTGRENIWLSAAYMGHMRHEIARRLEEIIDFADIGEFIDLPTFTYSAGMRARLAFSVVTSFQPEILLIDESVGAGDKKFAAKAAERLRQFIGHSNILMLATHNESLMRSWCDSSINVLTGETTLF